MDLQPFNLPNKYIFFDNLLQAINGFVSLQGYAIVKRRIKVSKKRVLRKPVLIYDWNKEYYSEYQSKRETSSQKTDCFFDALAILETDRWIFQLRNGSHNHEVTLSRVHPTYQKVTQTKKVLKSIANHAKTEAPPQ